ncbi:MAG: NAD-dependent epimerase/dehydratase family protein [Bacilli bacterium]|nr:NAD-dependent epimerase/dehydratase family protein [Bacilli bacterium]
MDTAKLDEYDITSKRLYDEKIATFLENKTIFITGATGLIGTQVGKSLIRYRRQYGGKFKIVLQARNVEKLMNRYKEDLVEEGVYVVLGDIRDMIIFDGKVDYIIHCASNTSSAFFVTNPVETIDILVSGTKNALEFAKEKRVKGFLYLSTLEVYGDVFDDAVAIDESAFHYLDFLSVRSSYPEGKRMCECLCSSYYHEYGVPILIARLTQTIGSDIEPYDNRVFAEFARCSVKGKDIVLKTAGETVRSYCDVIDGTVALFYILSKGEFGNAYNVANNATICSIMQLAELFRSLSKYNINIVFDRSANARKLGYNNDIKIRLDTSKIESLGWKPSYSLKDTVLRLMKGLALNGD